MIRRISSAADILRSGLLSDASMNGKMIYPNDITSHDRFHLRHQHPFTLTLNHSFSRMGYLHIRFSSGRTQPLVHGWRIKGEICNNEDSIWFFAPPAPTRKKPLQGLQEMIPAQAGWN